MGVAGDAVRCLVLAMLMVGVTSVADEGPPSPPGKLSIFSGGGGLLDSDDGPGDCWPLLGDTTVEDVRGEKLPGARPELARWPAEPEPDDEFMAVPCLYGEVVTQLNSRCGPTCS